MGRKELDTAERLSTQAHAHLVCTVLVEFVRLFGPCALLFYFCLEEENLLIFFFLFLGSVIDILFS